MKNSKKVSKTGTVIPPAQQQSQMLVTQTFSPLPSPEMLAQYEHLRPGLIDEIINMTKEQSEHRRSLEIAQTEAHVRQLDAKIAHQKRRDCEAKLGQIFAFIIAIVAIFGGVYTALQGYQTAGSIISAIGLTGIVSHFIQGRKTPETKGA
jgi:uncharacterized membrane protein